QAAFSATPINSTSLRGRTPEVQGFVLILEQASAHGGSHARSVSNAASHGPVSVRGLFAPVVAPWSLAVMVSFLPVRPAPVCGGGRPHGQGGPGGGRRCRPSAAGSLPGRIPAPESRTCSRQNGDRATVRSRSRSCADG